ncbi:MAG TPA: GNAT family N-acetyltransferase [Actinospica sp.]|nr:GNAT family N-acetyltransferase [Actinospica sp.]
MEIRRLDPHGSDRTELDPWYRAMREGSAADRVAPIVVEREAVMTSLRSNESNPNYDRRAYGAWDGEECVGTAIIGLPRRDNTHVAEIEIAVPPHARRRGVGRALFDHLYDLARREGRTVLAAEVEVAGAGENPLEESAGGRFALSFGFSPKHSEFRLLLDVPVPEEQLKALEAVAVRRAGEYRVTGWIGLPPAEVLDRFAEMHTLMDADVPSGELSREPVVYDAERVQRTQERLIEQGYGLVTTLVGDADDAPVGYTTMFVAGGAQRDVLQDNTFILRAHRGHGLATLAKVANLRRLAESYPQAAHVHTWTAEVNDAMHAVNSRLGFRPVETMYELELDLEQAAE